MCMPTLDVENFKPGPNLTLQTAFLGTAQTAALRQFFKKLFCCFGHLLTYCKMWFTLPIVRPSLQGESESIFSTDVQDKQTSHFHYTAYNLKSEKASFQCVFYLHFHIWLKTLYSYFTLMHRNNLYYYKVLLRFQY